MKKTLFALYVLVTFIGMPLSILFVGLGSASFIGAGSGMFLANFTGHAPVSGPFTFIEFLMLSIGLVLLTYIYAKLTVTGIGRFARWADGVNLS